MSPDAEELGKSLCSAQQRCSSTLTCVDVLTRLTNPEALYGRVSRTEHSIRDGVLTLHEVWQHQAWHRSTARQRRGFRPIQTYLWRQETVTCLGCMGLLTVESKLSGSGHQPPFELCVSNLGIAIETCAGGESVDTVTRK